MYLRAACIFGAQRCPCFCLYYRPYLSYMCTRACVHIHIVMLINVIPCTYICACGDTLCLCLCNMCTYLCACMCTLMQFRSITGQVCGSSGGVAPCRQHPVLVRATVPLVTCALLSLFTVTCAGRGLSRLLPALGLLGNRWAKQAAPIVLAPRGLG